MTRFVRSAVSILLTLSALASGNSAVHLAQIRRATKRSMMSTSMSKKASKTKKGKSSKNGSGNSNGNGGGVGASPNCVTSPGSCLAGSCVNDFATLRDNTANGDNSVLCKDAPILVTQIMELPSSANVRISCCDQCDFGCKIQLEADTNMFEASGSGAFALDGVGLNGNGFVGDFAITTIGLAVTLSNAIISGFTSGDGAVIFVANGMLSGVDTLIEDNQSLTGTVRLLNSWGNFVRTQFLNNTSDAAEVGGAVTVSPDGGTFNVDFEDSTFSNNAATCADSANDVFVRSGGTATVNCDPDTNSNSNNGDGVEIGSDVVDFRSTCMSLQ